jgi:hypothetical protein
MRKLSTIVFIILSITIMSCASTKMMERVELIELERKGYSIHLDSNPLKIGSTYLNETNISEVKIDRKMKYVNIHRKTMDLNFHSVADIINEKRYDAKIDMVTVDGLVLDSVMIQDFKFEDGAVRNTRLLTQKDYEGTEFDDLPQVKQTVGNGILIISTR